MFLGNGKLYIVSGGCYTVAIILTHPLPRERADVFHGFNHTGNGTMTRGAIDRGRK